VAYHVKDAAEMEPRSGAVRLVRRELGIKSLGVNQYRFPPEWPDYPEHDETETNHEELYFVLAGGGTMTVDGDDVKLIPGRYVYVSPESKRKILPGPEGLEYLPVGGPADREFGGWSDL